MLAQVIDSDNQGEIGLLLHNGGKEEYLWNKGDTLGCLFISPYYSALFLRSMENYNNPIQEVLLVTRFLGNKGLGYSIR